MSAVKIAPPVEGILAHLINLSIRLKLNEERCKENRDPFCCHVDQSIQYLDTYPVR